jgi:hypothetical protein
VTVEHKNKEESVEIVTQLLQEKRDTGFETLAAWPSGRTLQISMDTRTHGDSLIIRNISGSVELRLEFQDDGPRLIAPGGKLRVESEDIAFQANSMNFEVKNNVDWKVDGEFNVRSKSTNLISINDTSVNGRFIKLNCDQPSIHDEDKTVNCGNEQDS